MTSFILPYIQYRNNIENEILLTNSEDFPTQKINKTLYLYLEKIKGGIDNCAGSWEKYKKYTNPYEYIHTPYKKGSPPICLIKPLSR